MVMLYNVASLPASTAPGVRTNAGDALAKLVTLLMSLDVDHTDVSSRQCLDHIDAYLRSYQEATAGITTATRLTQDSQTPVRWFDKLVNKLRRPPQLPLANQSARLTLSRDQFKATEIVMLMYLMLYINSKIESIPPEYSECLMKFICGCHSMPDIKMERFDGTRITLDEERSIRLCNMRNVYEQVSFENAQSWQILPPKTVRKILWYLLYNKCPIGNPLIQKLISHPCFYTVAVDRSLEEDSNEQIGEFIRSQDIDSITLTNMKSMTFSGTIGNIVYYWLLEYYIKNYEDVVADKVVCEDTQANIKTYLTGLLDNEVLCFLLKNAPAPLEKESDKLSMVLSSLVDKISEYTDTSYLIRWLDRVNNDELKRLLLWKNSQVLLSSAFFDSGDEDAAATHLASIRMSHPAVIRLMAVIMHFESMEQWQKIGNLFFGIYTTEQKKLRRNPDQNMQEDNRRLLDFVFKPLNYCNESNRSLCLASFIVQLSRVEAESNKAKEFIKLLLSRAQPSSGSDKVYFNFIKTTLINFVNQYLAIQSPGKMQDQLNIARIFVDVISEMRVKYGEHGEMPPLLKFCLLEIDFTKEIYDLSLERRRQLFSFTLPYTEDFSAVYRLVYSYFASAEVSAIIQNKLTLSDHSLAELRLMHTNGGLCKRLLSIAMCLMKQNAVDKQSIVQFGDFLRGSSMRALVNPQRGGCVCFFARPLLLTPGLDQLLHKRAIRPELLEELYHRIAHSQVEQQLSSLEFLLNLVSGILLLHILHENDSLDAATIALCDSYRKIIHNIATEGPVNTEYIQDFLQPYIIVPNKSEVAVAASGQCVDKGRGQAGVFAMACVSADARVGLVSAVVTTLQHHLSILPDSLYLTRLDLDQFRDTDVLHSLADAWPVVPT